MLADRATAVSRAERRLMTHRLYLGLASFTSEYLAHQAFEELEVAPALSAAMSVEELVALNEAIVASIPPDEMATALSLMLPAMNIEDQVAMLGGMQVGAPPQVFAGVIALAESLLAPVDFRALAARLGIA